MRRALLVSASACAAAACGGQDYLVVTVDRRPAVHDAASLRVTLGNGGSMRTDELALGAHAFPVTFSVASPGRSGDLDIAVDALDASGVVVGHGTATSTVDAASARVLVDSMDFVVNTDFADDQYLSTDFEAMGFQLAALADGTWTAAFRDTCTDCRVYARRFDATGAPVSSAAAAGTNAFPVTTTLTTGLTTPAVVVTNATTAVIWDSNDPATNTRGVACRSFDRTGMPIAAQTALATGESSDVVSATALSNGNLAVTWTLSTSPSTVRTIIARPDCTTLTAGPITVSAGSASAHRSHVAANADKVMYAWIVNHDVHVRAATNAAAFTTGDTAVLSQSSSDGFDFVRLAPLGTGFAIVVRTSPLAATDPGKLLLYKASATGVLLGKPTVLASTTFNGDNSFAVASRADGALLVAWHQCGAGPGTCDVYGRIVRPTGVPVGDAFQIPTTTTADQTGPSLAALDGAFVAGWTDSSAVAPDTSGTAVRARILYPPFDDAVGVLGARCGADLPACGAGLTCALGSDAALRCYEVCTPPVCPDGGTCSTIDATVSACTY